MRRLHVWLVVLVFLLQTGCWDKSELTDWGFVQALAIDLTEEGRIELRTHIYKPTGGAGGSMMPVGGQTYINILTEADTVFQAARDVTLDTGRKSQWSHMRTLLISEQAAREREVADLIDFFIRDHEPRGNVSIIITQGKAEKYLDLKPFYENTIGQQVKEVEETGAEFTSKTSEITLVDLMIQLRGEVNNAVVPYLYASTDEPRTTPMSGLVVLKDGKMVGDIIPSNNVISVEILRKQFKTGILEIPCDKKSKSENIPDAIEVMKINTKVKPVFRNQSLTINVSTKISGAIGELHCAPADTLEEQKKFIKRLEKQVKKDLRKTIQLLQSRKIDVLNIGNSIYRHDPKLWKQIKEDWPEHFAKAKINIHVDVSINTSGIYLGKPQP